MELEKGKQMGDNSPHLSDHATLADEVYKTIRGQILSFELPPGTRIKDSQLAASLGTSNTPVREALRRLEEASLVETLPRRGTFVKQLNRRELEGLYQVREALERLALESAADRASADLLDQIVQTANLHARAVERKAVEEYLEFDRRFHELIAEGADNPVLGDILRGLADRIHIFRRYDLGQIQDETSAEEHCGIAAALRRRDSAEAVALMMRHIEKTRSRVIAALDKGDLPGQKETDSQA
jgi:DNA-binding GntR family transcriptional regulator